ncbi:MAG: uroporphyrinogen-III synthase [Hydrogenophaga sp.]|nr:uroporphyrinogen-III synthase [Hydrogenophaga sp.]
MSPRPGGRIDRLVVTRPAQEATAWVSALRAAGWPALALPLIDIGEPQDAASRQALAHWRVHWPALDALMFVSPAAVQHFFLGMAAPPAGAPVRTHTLPRFWSPGPGTARALAQALSSFGIGTDRIDSPPADAPQFDSESLWPVVRPQLRPGQQLLIVRGLSRDAQAGPAEPDGMPGHGRDWLIRQCEGLGVRVQACAAYERRAPCWGSETRAVALAAGGTGSVWLFSSSEALTHLARCAPAAGWGAAQALVTHPRIAERAREMGFGRVLQTRPALTDVLGTLESNWSPS